MSIYDWVYWFYIFLKGQSLIMINKLTYEYVETISKLKGYNLQSQALREFIAKNDKQKFLNDLNKTLSEFNHVYTPYITQDIVFKNNSLVTRNSKLISPAHYFYYTKLVFDLVLDKYGDEKLVSYQAANYKSYYSGLLFTNINDLNRGKLKEIMFDHSFGLFQQQLKAYENTQALKIDIANFFDSIKVEMLLEILYRKFNWTKVESLDQFFKTFKIKSLPQFHYSIASSILSQEYLFPLDKEIDKILKENKFMMLRFVDDMYFFNIGSSLYEKDFHNLLDRINKVLWKYNLSLNSNKIKLYVENLFQYETVEEYNQLFMSSEKKIEEKAISLLEGDLIKFVKETNDLYNKRGFNIKDFKEIVDKRLSINGHDALKVLKNFIFGKKWEKLDNEDIKYIIKNNSFIFYLPDILFTFYLKLYERYEMLYGRDEVTIRILLNEIDENNSESLRYMYASLHYLIQRNFKRDKFIAEIRTYTPELAHFIELFIKKRI